MKVTPIPHDLDLALSQATRSPGLHMSDIYGDLYQDLEPKRYTRGTAPDPLRLEAGLALESVLEEGLKRRLATRPGEFRTKEGIIFSPDLLVNNGVLRLGEIKLTWMSSRDVPREPTHGFPARFDKYFTQMMSYAHALETNYGRLYGFFVNGNYKPPTPELLAWDLEFTAREMRENWNMMMTHARSKRML